MDMERARSLANGLADHIWEVPGCDAVMLGGSLTKGFFDKHSDIDIGVFCQGDALPADEFIAAIEAFGAKNLWDDRGFVYRQGNEDKYAWLGYEDIEFDVRFHPTAETTKGIESFLGGDVPDPTGPYYAHPLGKPKSYLAFTIYDCEVLHERDQTVSRLQKMLDEFPDHLYDEFVWGYLEDVEWALENRLEKMVARDDFLFVHPMWSRLLRMLVVVVCSVNNTYLPDDKWQGRYLRRFEHVPERFVEDLEAFRSIPPESSEALEKKTEILERMLENTRKLAVEQLEEPNSKG